MPLRSNQINETLKLLLIIVNPLILSIKLNRETNETFPHQGQEIKIEKNINKI